MPPQLIPVQVNKLALDLANYRTVQQSSEPESVKAMVATSPDRFWALTKSLLDSGYLSTDNIVVLRSADGTLVVKEGNRRIAALKLVYKILPRPGIPIPDDVTLKMDSVSKEWLAENRTVPCAVYEQDDSETVDKIVTLAHGKGEKAGRDPWKAVARARHNRARGQQEPTLDLLEAYLKDGANITDRQRALWAGDYPYTVLEEAIKKLAPRMGLPNSPALAKAYPSVPYRDPLEAILYGIGQNRIKFEHVRSTDFAVAEGIPLAPAKKATTKTEDSAKRGGGKKTKASKKPARAYPLNDPRSVLQKLRWFVPRGKDRHKVADLLEEAKQLHLETTPLAFCFVLRSMFEISASAFCKDHSIPRVKKKDGRDKTLKEILNDVVKQLLATHRGDKDLHKSLHGSQTQLAQPSNLLSVTSMNALVHNPNFNVSPKDICTLFHQVFPLLEAMNS